ncbi:hypothetical protein ACFL3F_03970 [Planctomycetota bacterium]
MYLTKDMIKSIAQVALNMKAEGKENWCLVWLEWLWQEEIERAIWSIKQVRR